MICSNCGGSNLQSEHLHRIKDTNSASSSCLGYLLLGPIGLLLGVGSVKSKIEMYWVCQNCGNKWRDRKEYIKEATKSIIVAIVITILVLAGGIYLTVDMGTTLFLYIAIIVVLIQAVRTFILCKKTTKLKSEMIKFEKGDCSVDYLLGRTDKPEVNR
jgi:hypothetical protein